MYPAAVNDFFTEQWLPCQCCSARRGCWWQQCDGAWPAAAATWCCTPMRWRPAMSQMSTSVDETTTCSFAAGSATCFDTLRTLRTRLVGSSHAQLPQLVPMRPVIQMASRAGPGHAIACIWRSDTCLQSIERWDRCMHPTTYKLCLPPVRSTRYNHPLSTVCSLQAGARVAVGDAHIPIRLSPVLWRSYVTVLSAD